VTQSIRVAYAQTLLTTQPNSLEEMRCTLTMVAGQVVTAMGNFGVAGGRDGRG